MLTTAPNAESVVEAPPVEAREFSQAPATTAPLPEELDRMIAEAAYYIAERRGFEPGHETDDWLQAEAQVYDSVAASAR
jgi:DUF2934 family protein